MLSHNGQVVLNGETARKFFHAARNPDTEELRRRDEILSAMERDFPYRVDGADFVMEIPDVEMGDT